MLFSILTDDTLSTTKKSKTCHTPADEKEPKTLEVGYTLPTPLIMHEHHQFLFSIMKRNINNLLNK